MKKPDNQPVEVHQQEAPTMSSRLRTCWSGFLDVCFLWFHAGMWLIDFFIGKQMYGCFFAARFLPLRPGYK